VKYFVTRSIAGVMVVGFTTNCPISVFQL